MVKSCWKPLIFAPNSMASKLKVGSNRVQKRSKTGRKTCHHTLVNDVLTSKGNIRKNVTQFQSQQHQLLVTQVNKIVMIAFDDKSFILEDGFPSFVYGLHSLEQSMTFCIDILVALNFDLNVIDSYLSKLFRCPLCTQ